jgi:hypothetical protein
MQRENTRKGGREAGRECNDSLDKPFRLVRMYAGSELRVYGLDFRDEGSVYKVHGAWCRV